MTPPRGGRAEAGPVRDDRVLPYSRALSWFIAPFLLAGFALLYLFPADTRTLFAWTIRPTMTPMVMGSAYLGGFFFFVRVPHEARWATVKTGFASVGLFATLLGVATILHWGVFNHRHPAFWVWAALYFAAPVLVLVAWLANRRVAAPAEVDEPRLGRAVRWVVGVVGAAALTTGLVMFLAPARVIPVWPWALTPLTCRVVGAVFSLGSAGIGVLHDPRWAAVRLMLQVEVVMIVLMLAAAARAHGELRPDRFLTWVMAAGFTAVLAGSGALWFSHEVRARSGAG